MWLDSLVTPILIPILAMFIPIVAITAHFLSKAHSERQRHETIRELARAGQPIPPELLQDVQDSGWQRAQRDPQNHNRILIPGVINVGAGIGLMGMFAVMMPGAWLWAIGLIPLCLGIGFLVVWAILRKQSAAL